MKEPSDLHKSLIEEAFYLRGRILASYSQIEFLLADISVKLDLKFPYRIEKRIKAVKRIAERPGYEGYKDELSKVCDELLRYDELRNFMAHGFMMLNIGLENSHEFEIQLYQRTDSENFNLITIKTSIPRMKAASDQITEYCSHAMRLFSRIYLEKRLEDPSEGILIEPRPN